VGFVRDPTKLAVVGDSAYMGMGDLTGREDLRSLVVLNKFGPSGHGEAQVQYLDGDFRVISPGTYVRCAVTDERIPLDELKYWSVDLQEAYALPAAVLKRHFPGALKPAD
jgi:hypothetical protein